MNRYTIVYTFLTIVMVALVYVIGMPWKTERRETVRHRDPQNPPRRIQAD